MIGIIRISRSVKELGIKISELNRIYQAKTGESLCIKRLSEILELPEESIYMAMEAGFEVESLHSKIGEEGRELLDILVSEEDEEKKIIDRITLIELINSLNDREQKIINLRYFNDKTQSQVADILGISQVHVSRIEKKILKDFKEMMII